ncbi:MAG: O-antigen ligase family protein, partial [Acidobacteriota bacterium]
MARRKKPQKKGPARGRSSAARPASGPSRKPGRLRKWASSTALDPTLFGLWLLIALPPLIFIPGLTDNFRLPKLLLTELLGLFSLLLLAFRLWRGPRLDLPGILGVLKAPGIRLVLPIVAAGSLGLFFGEHAEVTRRALPSLWIGGACLIGWALALKRREQRLLLTGLLAPAALLATFAVLQFHNLFDPFSFQGRVTDRIGLTSLAGGAFDLSGYLVLPLLIAQAALPTASKRWRLVLGVFLGLGLWASVASRTVTALLALVVGSALLWRRAAPRRRLLGVGALGLAAALVLVTVGPLKDRARKIGTSLQKGEINRLLTGRLDAWRGAAWMLEQHPIVGVGHGAYRAEFGPARLELSAEGVTFFRGQKQVFFTNAHSDFLDALAEWGLLGAAVLMICAFFFVRHLRRRWRLEADAEVARGPPT